MGNDMEQLTLMFDSACTYLGELATQEGAFARFTLTRDGEELLGNSIEDWQTQGIVVLEHKPNETEGFVVVDRRIQPREPEFAKAFQHWSALHGLKIISLPEGAIACWEKILHLPLHPVERHSMISAVCRLPKGEVLQWMSALDEARAAVEKA